MTSLDSRLQARAAAVAADLRAQDDAWGCSGWTRRRFLAGVGMAGAAALGTQLVTTRASFAAVPDPAADTTVIVVFLRGAADGLRVLQPNTSELGLDLLRAQRYRLVLPQTEVIELPDTGGWALNSRMQPVVQSLWSTGELAFVPAVAAPGLSRSHFQAQQWLEKGGSDTAATGWLERVLELIGPGTTFRAVAEGPARPMSFSGTEPSLSMHSIDDFVFPDYHGLASASQDALLSLYRGLGSPLASDVAVTIDALATAAQVRAGSPSTVTYPDGDFGLALRGLASMLRAEVGLQVASVDIGGWDTHTDELPDLDDHIAVAAASLAAFMDDLGPERRSRVTVVVMTEFGRRVLENDSGGTDHGHGSVMWLLGGGLAGSGVYGKWDPLSDGTLADGDIAGLNNPLDILGEVVQKRLNIGSLTTVFPGHTVTPIGVAKTP